MLVFLNKGAIEIVNHKVDFANLSAPTGLDREGFLGWGKSFLARGLLLYPSRTSHSYFACYQFIPQTFLKLFYQVLAPSKLTKAICTYPIPISKHQNKLAIPVFQIKTFLGHSLYIPHTCM